MKKAVFYGRYSSTNQNEQSIEGQLHVCERYAQSNDIMIVGQYIDRALSGTSDNRPQFQRMIADSARGEWDTVLVYKLDRFARNRYDSALYKKKLRDNGCKVVSATEQITDSPEGIIMEGLLEAMDEYYSAELSRKMHRGIEESFRKGYYLKHNAPFGYRLENRRLTIDDKTAPIVVQIFRDYLDGKKIGEIADELNSKGIPTAIGKSWKSMDVSRLLHRRLYIGEYTFGNFEGIMPCPQIVPRDLYDAVQTYIAQSVLRRRHRGNYDYMLTGKLKCALCGNSICGFTTEGYHYYRCRHCKKPHAIPADHLHDKTLQALADYMTPDKVTEIAAAAYAEYKAEEQPDERPALERELKTVDTQIQNAVNAILAGAALPELQDRLEQLKERQAALRAALAEQSAPVPRLTEEHFRLVLSDMVEKSGAELLKTVVELVILKGDTVIICINLTDEHNVPPLEQILFKVSDVQQSDILNKVIYVGGYFVIAA